MAISRNDRPAPAGGCFDKALDLLSRRPHFRRELARKLSMRGFPGDEIDSALDRATELGYLDDLECARQVARVRVERRHEGPARLRATLLRKGCDSDVVRRVVDDLYRDGEAEQLGRSAEAWLRRNTWDRDRLGRHLDRRGFSQGAILSELDRLRQRVSSGEDFDR